MIHILDYKPEANKINAVNQLTIYALALASRTKLAVKDFKCAWFDDRSYYEFFPLHVVYKTIKQTAPEQKSLYIVLYKNNIWNLYLRSGTSTQKGRR